MTFMTFMAFTAFSACMPFFAFIALVAFMAVIVFIGNMAVIKAGNDLSQNSKELLAPSVRHAGQPNSTLREEINPCT